MCVGSGLIVVLIYMTLPDGDALRGACAFRLCCSTAGVYVAAPLCGLNLEIGRLLQYFEVVKNLL